MSSSSFSFSPPPSSGIWHFLLQSFLNLIHFLFATYAFKQMQKHKRGAKCVWESSTCSCCFKLIKSGWGALCNEGQSEKLNSCFCWVLGTRTCSPQVSCLPFSMGNCVSIKKRYRMTDQFDFTISEGPFQPLQLCDPVILILLFQEKWA